MAGIVAAMTITQNECGTVRQLRTYSRATVGVPYLVLSVLHVSDPVNPFGVGKCRLPAWFLAMDDDLQRVESMVGVVIPAEPFVSIFFAQDLTGIRSVSMLCILHPHVVFEESHL